MLSEWSLKASGDMPHISVADLSLAQNKQMCEKQISYGEDTQFSSFDHYLQQTQEGIPAPQIRQPTGSA